MILIFLCLAYAQAFWVPAQNVLSILAFQSQPPKASEATEIINRNDFHGWLDIQPQISVNYILRNIGGTSNDTNLAPGVVIASPSNEKPDYYYTWTRDSALTINSLVTYLNDIEYKNLTIARQIEYYINNNYLLQRLDNPSGSFSPDYRGLGEPKFEVDNTAFVANWGRPQNDGPALRAITVMNYINLVNKYNQGKVVLGSNQGIYFNTTADIYFSIVKPDLIYIINYWQDKGFDLWEEHKGNHFFTSLVQFKALKKAVLRAKELGDYKFAKTLSQTSTKLLHFIEVESNFVDHDLNRINENPEITLKYGLDVATIIASAITHSQSNDIDDNQGYEVPFDVDDSYILNSLYEFIKNQNQTYPINHDSAKLGVSLGRYPNDRYDGVGVSLANPWFLSNGYASLFFYRKVFGLFHKKQSLVIFQENYQFYNEIIVDLATINADYKNQPFIIVPYGSVHFTEIVFKLIKFGDTFLKTILSHISNDGELSEQFNRVNGYSEGAKSLTWSYTSVLSAIRERKLVEKFLNERII